MPFEITGFTPFSDEQIYTIDRLREIAENPTFDRRHFLKSGLAAGSTTVVLPAAVVLATPQEADAFVGKLIEAAFGSALKIAHGIVNALEKLHASVTVINSEIEQMSGLMAASLKHEKLGLYADDLERVTLPKKGNWKVEHTGFEVSSSSTNGKQAIIGKQEYEVASNQGKRQSDFAISDAGSSFRVSPA